LSRLFESIWRDVRVGVRSLLNNPGYSVAAALTLAAGIGANTAIFSVVYGVLLRPLPYDRGEDLVVLRQTATARGLNNVPFSVKEIEDYRGATGTLDGVVEHHSMVFLLLGENFAERVQTAVVSANFFEVLGVRPLYGRMFAESDDKPESDGVLVLSHAYWTSRHGADPAIVGRTFAMNNRPHRVIGVLPPIPQYPNDSDVYMPASHCPTRSSQAFRENRAARMMTVFARRKAPLEQVRAETSTIARQTQQAYPELYPANYGYALSVNPLREELTAAARPGLLVLMGATGFVLLIACANVANLMLARMLRKERELALRLALGATRWRLVRQLLAESTVLALAGGVIGVALAPLTLDMLKRFAGRLTPRAAEISLDWPVVAFALAVSVATGVGFCLAPALAWGRNLSSELRHSAASGRSRLRTGLVVTQVAVSFLLLTGAGLMLRSFLELMQVQAGFPTERLLAMRLSANNRKYRTPADYRNLAERILLAMQTVGGVRAAAMAGGLPFDATGIALGPSTTEFQIEGRPVSRGELAPVVDTTVVSPGYFATIGQPVLEGRGFSENEDTSRPLVGIVNATMARHRWPGESAVGKRVTFDQGKTWTEIIGVAGDVREYGLGRNVGDVLYQPYKQAGFVNRLVARTAGEPMAVAAEVRRALHGVDPELAVDLVSSIERMREESVAPARVTALLLGMFALLAAGISAGGIGAVIALSVSQRRKELGIRMALGAGHGSVIRGVIGHGLAMTCAGAVLGIAGAVALTRYLEKLLYGVSPVDPLTFAGVTVLFLIVAAAACLIPAWRITSIDPLTALRQE